MQSIFPTLPTFYIVPVTSKLVNAICKGKYPKKKKVVRYFQPEIRGQNMLGLEDRKLVLQYYAAFQKFVKAMDDTKEFDVVDTKTQDANA
jgi:hypothetical protein